MICIAATVDTLFSRSELPDAIIETVPGGHDRRLKRCGGQYVAPDGGVISEYRARRDFGRVFFAAAKERTE